MKPYEIALMVVGIATALCLLAVFLYLSNNLLCVTRHTLSSAKIREEGVKIVHLSDIHGKSFGKGNKKLLNKVEGEHPDFIAVTGDIIHKYRERDIAVAISLVRGLSKIAPVCYVSGNHEMRNKNYRFLKAKLKEAGAIVLDDSAVSICAINLCGVNCANIRKGNFEGLVKDGKFNLLLAHLPQYIKSYSACGYDLALCGHAHGGQWRIPFTRQGVYAPGQGLFPKYTSGIHLCGNMHEVISRGLGNSECPVRLFNRPEMVVINLKKGQ